MEGLWSITGSTPTARGVTSTVASDKGSETFDFASEDADIFLDRGAVGGSTELLLGVRDPSGHALGKGGGLRTVGSPAAFDGPVDTSRGLWYGSPSGRSSMSGNLESPSIRSESMLYQHWTKMLFFMKD